MRLPKNHLATIFTIVLVIMLMPVVSATDCDNGWSTTGSTRIGPDWKGSAPLHDELLTIQNLSVQYQPLAFDSETGQVYFRTIVGDDFTKLYRMETNGSFTLVHTFAAAIQSAFVGTDSALMVSASDATIQRSTDDGDTWGSVQSLQTGTYIWNWARTGTTIFAGEYGTTAHDMYYLYKSTNEGATWSIANKTTPNPGGFEHIHDVYVDPHSGSIMYAEGDTKDGIKISTDFGATWAYFGPNIQPCTIVADDRNVYFGDDTFPRVWIYNKTTNDFSIGSWFGYNSAIAHDREGSFWDSIAGQYGVKYFTTYREGDTRHQTGVYCTLDGIDYYQILSTTGGVRHIVGPVDGWVYVMDADESSSPRHYGYTTRFRDLTVEDAKRLIYTVREDAPESDFESQRTGKEYDEKVVDVPMYDGHVTAWDFSTDPVTDAKLEITGVTVENLVTNPGFETSEDLWAAPGWDASYYAPHVWNMTVERTTSKAWEGSYSMMIICRNYSAGYIGYIDMPLFTGLAVPVPANTVYYVTFHYYFANQTDPLGYGLGLKTYAYGSPATPQAFGREYNVSGGYVFGNTAPTWSTWTYQLRTLASTTTLGLRFFVKSNFTMYMDAVQVTEGRRSPYIVGDADTENPTVCVNGVNYTHYGSVDDGETVQIDLLDSMGGVYDVAMSVEGSRICDCKLIGTRAADLSGCYGHYEGDSFEFDMDYGAGIRVWNSFNMTPGTLFDGRPGTFTVTATYDSANITFDTWALRYIEHGDIVAEWLTTDAEDGTMTYHLSGLNESVGYRVYENGTQIYVVYPGHTDMSFIYDGNGNFTISVYDPYGGMNALIPVAIMVSVMVAVVAIVVGFKR